MWVYRTRRLAALLMPALLASTSSDDTSNDEVHLVQRSLITNRARSIDFPFQDPSKSRWASSIQLPTADVSEASWVAGPFSSCHHCTPPIKFRDVSCRSYIDGREMEGCNSSSRPAETTTCACPGTELCEVAPAELCDKHLQRIPAVQFPVPATKHVGCYERDLMDDVELCSWPVLDDFCGTWKLDGPCRSGLPFYRWCPENTTDLLQECINGCVHKGYDIIGLVDNQECRCGYSRLNSVMTDRYMHPGLQFPNDLLVKAADGTCPVNISRFIGPFESGWLPRVTSTELGKALCLVLD